MSRLKEYLLFHTLVTEQPLNGTVILACFQQVNGQLRQKV